MLGGQQDGGPGRGEPSDGIPGHHAAGEVKTGRRTAELLGVSHKSLQANWRAWGLPGTRVGKRVQFMERRVLAWIESHPA